MLLICCVLRYNYYLALHIIIIIDIGEISVVGTSFFIYDRNKK